jgi:type II secretion system protein J
MRRFVRTSGGLTIIEMMGAMLVSTILLSGAWQLFQGGMQSYQRGLQDVRMTQGARAVLRLVTRDVQRAMAARLPYGIRGATPPSSTLTPGESLTDGLALLTRPPLVAPSEGAEHHGAPQRIRYVLGPVPNSTTLALQRAAGAMSEKPLERLVPVQEQVQEFSVRYFDGQTWHATWQQAELPRAVEITLVVQSGGAQARASRFATLVTAD